MALKRYVCHAHPSLRIGTQIKFEAGFFGTTSAFLQKTVEENDLWQARIFEIPVVEEAELPKAPKIAEMDAAVAAVMGLDFNEDEPEVDPTADETPQEKVEHLDPTPAEPWNKGISATDINRMKVADLKAMANELDVEFDKETKVTASRLRRAIRLKLEV